MKSVRILLLLTFLAHAAQAQEARWKGRLYSTVGHSYVENFYGAMAAVVDHQATETLRLTGGVEAFRAYGYAATGAWQSRLPWLGGHWFLYNRYLYRLFSRWNVNEYSAHAALGFQSKHWRATLGLASRIMSPQRPYDRTGSTDYVFEPFNVMYEVVYRLDFGRDDRWSLALRAADYDDFVTDRGYQPMFSAALGRRVWRDASLYGRIADYPTGMLSLSANYYELFFNLGIQKKW